MPVQKFSISLPDDLVRDLDEVAGAEGLTRSAVIRESAAEYVASRKSSQYEAARKARVDAAIAGFADVASTWGDDPASGLEQLQQLRGESLGSNADD